MPSPLRYQFHFASTFANPSSNFFPRGTATEIVPQKMPTWSTARIYDLALSARGKLSSETSRCNADLRVLVAHANMLDTLVLELEDAANKKSPWFRETVSSACETRHVQWIDQTPCSSNVTPAVDNDSTADVENGIYELTPPSLCRSLGSSSSKAPIRRITERADNGSDGSDAESDEESDNLDLALVRVHSHQPDEHHHSSTVDNSNDQELDYPPQLVYDTNEESDDDYAISPPIPHLQNQIDMENFYPAKPQHQYDALVEDDYFSLPC